MGNLARTYSALGRHDDALAMKERVLEFSRRVLPENHPDIGEGGCVVWDLHYFDCDDCAHRHGTVQHQLQLQASRRLVPGDEVRARGAAHMAGSAAAGTSICCGCRGTCSSLRTGLAVVHGGTRARGLAGHRGSRRAAAVSSKFPRIAFTVRRQRAREEQLRRCLKFIFCSMSAFRST